MVRRKFNVHYFSSFASLSLSLFLSTLTFANAFDATVQSFCSLIWGAKEARGNHETGSLSQHMADLKVKFVYSFSNTHYFLARVSPLVGFFFLSFAPLSVEWLAHCLSSLLSSLSSLCCVVSRLLSPVNADPLRFRRPSFTGGKLAVGLKEVRTVN